MDRSQSPARRQQMKSCDSCRQKKVRCDAVNRTTCSQCRKLDKECSFTTQWKRPVRSRRKEPQDPSAQQPFARDGTSPSLQPDGTPDTSHSQTSSSGAGHLSHSAIVSLSWVRNSLNEFFQRGMGTQDWEVFDTKDVMRLAYIGTQVSNLSHLIDLLPQRQPGQHSNTITVPVPLHLPYPHTHPLTSWKPEAEQPLFGQHLNHDQADHLQDLAAFPVKDVRDALIDAYFSKINPYFPVIDESDFRRLYESTPTLSASNPSDSSAPEQPSSNPPPLLVMQAVLLAGAHVCDHPRVSQSRAIVKTALFARAKALFNMRHENNRLHLIQAALLFTWHVENADTSSANNYYWAGVACRIAFGIGMHRNLSPRDEVCMMPIAERRIYRRVWWTLFQTEIFTAVEHGRPSMISLDEIDQPLIEPEDFIEENGLLNSKLNFDYFQGNIDLCYMILEILNLNSPGMVARQGDSGLHMTRASLEGRLINWALKNPVSDDFWSLQLQLHYQTVVLLLHRGFIGTATTRNGSIVQIPYREQYQSSELCNRASHAIVSISESMLSKGFLIQSPFTTIVSITAAAVHLALEIRVSTEDGATLLALSTQNHLQRLFRPISELSQYWPHAEAVLVLLQSIDQGFRSRIEDVNRGSDHLRYFSDYVMEV